MIDAGTMTSWEVCGKRRLTQVDRLQPSFWSTGSFPYIKHALMSAGGPENRLVVAEIHRPGGEKGFNVFLADLSGNIVRGLHFEGDHSVEHIAFSSDGTAFACGKFDSEQKHNGIYYSPKSGVEWKLIHKVSASTADCRIDVHEDVVIWVEQGAVGAWDRRHDSVRNVEFPTRISDAKLSPDKTLLYLRATDGHTYLSEWPLVKPIRFNYPHIVESGGQWSPDGRYLLLERRTPLFVGLVAVDTTGAELSLGQIRAYGSAGHSLSWVRWGDQGPLQLASFQFRHQPGGH